MRFMGDYPMSKSQKDVDSIYYLLKTMNQEAELVDEIYCQLIKQTTNNTSTKKNSCFRGWKLISLFSIYFKPSDLLKPYLLKHLEINAYDTKRPCNGKIICSNSIITCSVFLLSIFFFYLLKQLHLYVWQILERHTNTAYVATSLQTTNLLQLR